MSERLNVDGRDPDTLTPLEKLAHVYPDVYALMQQHAAAAAAIGRVRELHRRAPYAPDHDPYCEVCRYDDGWPCPTTAALGGGPAHG